MRIKPMLCKVEEKPFRDPNWLWEVKYDGARIISAGGKLWARSGTDKTDHFPELKIVTGVPCVLDGEVISMAGGGFNDIQHRVNRESGISEAVKRYPACYMVFDMIEANGVDLRWVALEDRKELLKKCLVPTENVLLASSSDDGIALLDEVRARRGEGIVGKQKKSTYREGQREWVKVKLWQIGQFMAVGYTAGTGWRASTFGALVLSDMTGCYIGSVGTGFTEADIQDVRRNFSPGTCPWSRAPEAATWIKPFPVKIRFMERTNDFHLRFPSYKGMV